MLPTEAFRSPDRSNWSSEVLVSDEGVGGGGQKDLGCRNFNPGPTGEEGVFSPLLQRC